jgi:hypothetical protein
MEECLLKDENIASAVYASNMDLAKTLSAKHCLNFQIISNSMQRCMVTLYQQKMQKLQDSHGDGTVNLSQNEQIAKEMKVLRCRYPNIFSIHSRVSCA